MRQHVGIRALLAIAVALALADASVVCLALPPILGELDASVEGAAAVLGSYTLVLALALPPAAWLRGRIGDRALGAGGAVAFALASLVCGVAGSLGALLAFRAVQAVGGAALLVAAFALLDAGGAGRRLWTAAAIFGFAAGPALGGALTQALDWRAIFLVQAPVAAAAALAAWGAAAPSGTGARREPAAPADGPGTRPGPAVALALLSAALVGVLFLLVLLLVTGWSVSPLAAAAAVSVLPAVALAASRIGGPADVRAPAGAALLGGGVLALAWLPEASLWWTVLPQAMAGAGMGLALPALGGELLPERTPAQAARLLAARHAGITLALAVLAPLAAAQLDDAVAEARERGAALVLDARLPPLDKLELVGTLVGDLDPVDPRGELQAALAERAADPLSAELAQRADETLVTALQAAFAPAFVLCGALALLAALVILPRRRRAPVAAAGAAATALAVAAFATHAAFSPEPVRIADPCAGRELPSTGGIDGALQDAALAALDRAACRFGSSREELALALVDDGARAAYEDEHGVDPRDAGGLLGAVLGI